MITYVHAFNGPTSINKAEEARGQTQSEISMSMLNTN